MPWSAAAGVPANSAPIRPAPRPAPGTGASGCPRATSTTAPPSNRRSTATRTSADAVLEPGADPVHADHPRFIGARLRRWPVWPRRGPSAMTRTGRVVVRSTAPTPTGPVRRRPGPRPPRRGARSPRRPARPTPGPRSGVLPNRTCRAISRGSRTASSVTTCQTASSCARASGQRAVVEQQVVALGHHQVDLGPDRDRPGRGCSRSRSNTGAITRGPAGARSRRSSAAYPSGVEGLRRALAVPQPAPLELDVGEVEPVQRHRHPAVRRGHGAPPASTCRRPARR